MGAADFFNGGTGVKVGIGTPNPQTKLDVAGGDVYISSGGSGLILKTAGGFACYRLTVGGQGQSSTASITCPGSSGQ